MVAEVGQGVHGERQPAPPQGQVGGQVFGVPQPPRDVLPPKPGTSVISGHVTAADTGLPMRGAVITLMPQTNPAGRRTVLADSAGYFEFAGLPAGSYSLRADPGLTRGQYVSAPFGTSATEAVGRSIVLKDGQRFERADVALPRGGAIEGRVVDEFGEPVARASVYPVRVMGGGTSFGRSGPGSQTDDQGRFRIFGLTPAEYIVAVDARAGGMGMPVTEGETEGFATTYHPSAMVEREARRLRIAAGAEATGVQVQLIRTRSFRITGTVFDSQGRPVLNPIMMLARRTADGGISSGMDGLQVDPTGRFALRQVLPGEYRIVVRPLSGGGPPQLAAATAGPREYASVPISVSGDVDDLVIVTAPAISIGGTVVFAEGSPPKMPVGLRVVAQPADGMGMIGPPATAVVGEDLRFTLEEVFGVVNVRLQPVPQGYALESIHVGADEITDQPFEFRASSSGQLQVVLTSRVGGIEGQVFGDDGTPSRTGIVLVIPEDEAQWKVGASRMRTLVVRDGRYSGRAILPGRYHAVALPQENYMPGPNPARAFFESLVEGATSVLITEGESRTVDLRLFQAR